jgi:hypothetical protein
VERDAALLAGAGGDVDVAGSLLSFGVGWIVLEGPVVVLEYGLAGAMGLLLSGTWWQLAGAVCSWLVSALILVSVLWVSVLSLVVSSVLALILASFLWVLVLSLVVSSVLALVLVSSWLQFELFIMVSLVRLLQFLALHWYWYLQAPCVV